jgi:colanic acid biosynthesis protein WcaH
MFIPEPLYKQILQAMPIPCVDLLVVDHGGRVLLHKRRNDPAKGQWWAPGGRVHKGELRAVAAKRKLSEEFGITGEHILPVELSTEDLMLPDGQGGTSHVIATVYRIEVDSRAPLVLDAQSETAEWRTLRGWSVEDLHPYVHKITSRVWS